MNWIWGSSALNKLISNNVMGEEILKWKCACGCKDFIKSTWMLLTIVAALGLGKSCAGELKSVAD